MNQYKHYLQLLVGTLLVVAILGGYLNSSFDILSGATPKAQKAQQAQQKGR